MGVDKTEETSQPQEEEHLKVAKFTALEEDIKKKILTEVDPIAKANMEWELRILHSANMQFFQYGDAYNYYHLPTLPLPLLKMESQACTMKLKPNVPDEKLGGWADIDLIDWHKPVNGISQLCSPMSPSGGSTTSISTPTTSFHTLKHQGTCE